MELKPCPFCGGIAQLSHTSCGGIYDTTYVLCVGCGCKTKLFEISVTYAADDKAAEAWNRRANDGNCDL